MSASKIRRIGIVAPRAHRQVLGLTHVRRSFQHSFPQAEIFNLEEADLKSMNRLEWCDLIVLPPSFDGEDTPYRHYLKGRAAENLMEYAQFGRIASFCSGTWALLKKFSYTFNNGHTAEYNGYVPVIDLEAAGPVGADSSLRVVPVFTDAVQKDKPINLYYDGGPAIELGATAHPNIRPLAYFQDGKASVVAVSKSPKGIVVAFSALADMHARDIPAEGAHAQTHHHLDATREGHDALWGRAMAILETRDLNHP